MRQRSGLLADQAQSAGRGQLVVERVTDVAPDTLRGVTADALARLGYGPLP
ncbi:hypothetical protein [Streptomyces rimosus]|uniref:hypothetical protein n=1 Tax=Streptomyces rimosus TaxID=1927 RepID=UPI000AD72173|nr:hypothetical protein [Streptomyces rimosus]